MCPGPALTLACTHGMPGMGRRHPQFYGARYGSGAPYLAPGKPCPPRFRRVRSREPVPGSVPPRMEFHRRMSTLRGQSFCRAFLCPDLRTHRGLRRGSDPGANADRIGHLCRPRRPLPRRHRRRRRHPLRQSPHRRLRATRTTIRSVDWSSSAVADWQPGEAVHIRVNDDQG